MGTYDCDVEDIVQPGTATGNVIATFKFSIENKSSNAIMLEVDCPSLVSGDIIYDGHVNGTSCYYCITTDDNSSTISPLENKEYN